VGSEHEPEEIITLSLGGLFFFIAGGATFELALRFMESGSLPTNINLISLFQWRGYSLVAGAVSWILAVILYCRSIKVPAYYFLEKFSDSILLLAALNIGSAFFSSGRVDYFWQLLVIILTYLFTRPLLGYRSFRWYPSGRIGFLFLSTLVLFLVFEIILDLLLSRALYWQLFLEAGISLVSIVNIYFLSVKPSR